MDGEKGVGPELVRLYKLKGYPTLIVADGEGKPVLLDEGYVPTDYVVIWKGGAKEVQRELSD